MYVCSEKGLNKKKDPSCPRFLSILEFNVRGGGGV